MSSAIEKGGHRSLLRRMVTKLPVRQTRILSSRYSACMLGDLGTLALLVLQAPLIGWMCTLVWSSVEHDTPSLHFIMGLSAVWFGCISACREIVKERAIVERERFFGLSLGGYVASKFVVLGAIALVQVLLLQTVIESQLGVTGPFWVQTFALWGAALCGVGLGLWVSALSMRQERAVGAVPLLILPQVLFSSFVIPKSAFSTTVEVVEKFMPTHWSYEVFEQLASIETSGFAILGALGVLVTMTFALGLVSYLSLIPRREVT
ncbi:MAG: hypothetical protein AUK47_23380 [Deltaproteobacteria bacterium CG2_30_63_29]|nr:MAG: hypothetical protein AUK47_23380 [Deltaproteobacteria bacterium CG2_30_63_29]